MALPDSRNETYVAGTTKIPALTMNDLQDVDVLIWKLVAKGGIHLVDDFLGSTISNIWTLSGNTNETTGDDVADGGFGALKLDSTGGGADSSVKTLDFDISANDFWFHGRTRYVTAKAGIYIIGIYSSTAAQRIYFFYDTGSANWKTFENGNTTTTSTAVTTAYQRLDIVRLAGVVYFYINGALVHSIANTVDIAAAYVQARNQVGTGSPKNFVDVLKFNAPDRG